MKRMVYFLFATSIAVGTNLIYVPVADACTRVVYHGPNGTVITARSMDWREEKSIKVTISLRLHIHRDASFTVSPRA